MRNAQHTERRDRETRHSANEVRETGGSSFTQWWWTTQWEYPRRTKRHGDPRTTQWQNIPESFLEISRPSCGKLPRWRRTSDYVVAEYNIAALERPPASHVAVNYHKMELEEQTRREVAHRAARK